MEFAGRFLQIPSQICFLLGPRGTGKSIWLRDQLPDALYLDLLDPALNRSLSARPERLTDLLAGSPRNRTTPMGLPAPLEFRLHPGGPTE